MKWDFSDAQGIFVLGWPERLWFGWVTVIVPGLCFAAAFAEPLMPDWKSPELSLWPQLLLSGGPSLAFLPLAVPVVALCLAIFLVPGTWARALPARALLASGVVLSFQYAVLVFSALLLEGREDRPAILLVAGALLGLVAFALVLPFAWRWLRRFLGPSRLRIAVSVFLAALYLLLTSVALYEMPDTSWLEALGQALVMPLGLFFLVTLIPGPVWCGLALLRLLRRLGAVRGLGRPFLWLSALSAYLVCWRLALLQAMKAYEELPDSPPDCFVATAASRGPRWLVGAGPITPQVQRLKAFELLLREGVPALHRRLRRTYDRWGPRLAASLHTAPRAAGAWLVLKPAEGLALLLLAIVGGREALRRLPGLYRPAGSLR